MTAVSESSITSSKGQKTFEVNQQVMVRSPEMPLCAFRHTLLQLGDQGVLGHACCPDTGAEGDVNLVAIIVGDLHAAI